MCDSSAPLKLGIIPRVPNVPFDDVAQRIGWLITPAAKGHYALVVQDQNPDPPLVFPLAFLWHTFEPLPPTGVPLRSVTTEVMQRIAFGNARYNVSVNDCVPAEMPLHDKAFMDGRPEVREAIVSMMREIGGELRYVWGTLIAIGAGHLGAEAATGAPLRHNGPPVVAKGKTILPLERKVLTIKLSKRVTVEKVVARAISHHKNRQHEVRAHWRCYHNEDGTVRKRVPVKSHKRGDERLGRIEKTYQVQR